MKTKLILLAIGSPLLLVVLSLQAQDNFATNISTPNGTNTQTRADPEAFVGEQLLLPPQLKDKLKLTAAQKTELKPIEDDFAKTSQEFKVANQPRIDAAMEADQQARAAKNEAQIQAAQTQLQQVWAGLRPYRVAAVKRPKPLLTPEQLKILEDPKNQ